MKKTLTILCLWASCAIGNDLVNPALFMMEGEGIDTTTTEWHFSARDGAIYSFFCDSTNNFTLADVLSVDTNSAAFVAWRASRPDVLLAAELQQLSASLDALVFLEFGEHIDGTDEQLARISAVVVSSLESNRIEYAKAETLAELKAAGTRINNLRSIISLQAKIVSLRE